MKLAYPLQAYECKSYSHKIKDYRKLTIEDKRILVNNFKEFYKYAFWFLNLPFPTRDQLYMAKFLSASAKERDPLMLQAQRGLAKSLTLQIFTDWLLLRNKDEKIVVVSATSARAESFTKFCLSLIRLLPLLQHLEPQGEDRTSTKKFDVAGRTPDDSPSMAAFGVTSAKTGSRATFIIYDDVEIPENSDSAGKREKVLEGVRDTANLGVAGKYRETCICTPQSAESVYNVMVSEDGFKRTIVPAEYPEDVSVYGGDLAPHIEYLTRTRPHLVGSATDKRNNMSHLITQKVKGKARYKLHYMLDTTMSDSERYPLRLSDLVVTDLDPHEAPVRIIYSSQPQHTVFDVKSRGFRGDVLFYPSFRSIEMMAYEGKALFIDPSGRGSDETGYAVVAQYGGKIFVLDFGGIAGGYDESSMDMLAGIAKQFNVNAVVIESNFGDGAFTELIKPVLRREHNCMVEEIRSVTQKEKRIVETLEPIMMQHRLVVNKSALARDYLKPVEYSFTHQLTHITVERGSLKHDDVLDVVAMGVNYWVASMARDTNDSQQRYEDEQLQKEIDSFAEEFNIFNVNSRQINF